MTMTIMYPLNLNILLLLFVLVFPHREAIAQESCDECISFVKKLNQIDDTDECRSTCKRDQNKGIFTLEPKCKKKCCKKLCQGKKPQKACEKQNYCVDCTNDPEFRLKDDPEKDCDFIAENPDVRCPKKGVLKGCPETCNPLCGSTPPPSPAPSTLSTLDPVCDEKLNTCLPCVERGCFFQGGGGNQSCKACLRVKSICDNVSGYCIGVGNLDKRACIEILKEGCEQYL